MSVKELAAAFALVSGLAGCSVSDGTLQAELNMAFESVDEADMVPPGDRPFKKWMDTDGQCTVTFSNGSEPAVVAVSTLDKLRVYKEKFQVSYAMPVKCDDLEDAHKDVMATKGYANAKPYEGLSTEFAKAEREDVKRQVKEYVRENRQAVNSVGMHGRAH